MLRIEYRICAFASTPKGQSRKVGSGLKAIPHTHILDDWLSSDGTTYLIRSLESSGHLVPTLGSVLVTVNGAQAARREDALLLKRQLESGLRRPVLHGHSRVRGRLQHRNRMERVKIQIPIGGNPP